MDISHLETALTQMAALPCPELPANFEQGVWREIHSRKTARESVWDLFVAAFLRPGWAASGAVLTLLIAAGFGTWENIAPPSPAHLSLNLAVFSAEAPTLPSTLLSRTP